MMRFKFAGTGGELFGKLFVGFLLSCITCGIYLPWFMVSILKYVYSKTTFGPTHLGEFKLEFTGRGGAFFGLMFLGYSLTGLTLGIYAPWFLAKLLRFFTDNSQARSSDGTTYQLRFEASGGDLFVALFVGGLLTTITAGIYTPWFMCKLQSLISAKTSIVIGNQIVGNIAFNGTGGDLFVTFLVGYLLTMITLGIYMFWFSIKIWRFYASHTVITINGMRYAGDFDGTGGEYFVKVLIGGLLSSLTLGIYGFWFIADMLKWQFTHTPIAPVATR